MTHAVTASEPTELTASTKKPRRRSSESESELRKKFGRDVVDCGWTAVPNLLIEYQQRLELEPVELNIILILLKHWWRADDEAPYPSKKTLGEILNRDPSTVQKRVQALESRGLIKRMERTLPGKGRSSNGYDLSGLIAQLKALAKEEKERRQKQREDDGRRRRGK